MSPMVWASRSKLFVKLFTQRFCFRFIDEAQDTNDFQRDLLDVIFSQADQTIIIQKGGDNNQAIYSGLVDSNNFWMPYGNPWTLFTRQEQRKLFGFTC